MALTPPPAPAKDPWAFLTTPKFRNFAGNALADLGYGLTQGTDFGKALGAATQRTAQMQPIRNEEDAARQKAQELASERNQTAEWVKANYPEYANLPPAQAFQAAMSEHEAKQRAALGGGDTAPANVREWEHFNALSPDDQAAYLRMKRANPYLDTGTGYVMPDPINPGGTVGPAIAKDNYTPAYDSASGTATAKTDAENVAAAGSLSSKMPGLRQVVGELGTLAKTATYTTAGQLIDTARKETGMEPSEAAIARTKYIAMVDNQVLPLLRDTFGAAFTAKEGESLRATLGDPNTSPAEKQVVLEAFIEQKARDLEAMQSRIPTQGGGGGGGVDDLLEKYR